MFNKSDLANMMQQAQQMRDDFKKVEEKLETLEVEGQAGANMVRVTLTCNYTVKRIAIDPSIYDDKKMVEDLIVAAMNDGLRRVGATIKECMSSLDSRLPAGMKLPFS